MDNELDLEGLVAASSLGHGQTVRPELLREVIGAYAAVRPNLLQHSPDYPAAETLRGLVRAGQPVAAPETPVFEGDEQVAVDEQGFGAGNLHPQTSTGSDASPARPQ